MRYSLPFVVVALMPLIAGCHRAPVDSPAAETSPASAPVVPADVNTVAGRLAGLRWPMDDTVGLAGFEVERLIAEGSYDAARQWLDERIATQPWEAALAAITPEGAVPGEATTRLLAARDRGYHHALRWLLAGDAEDARKAREVLHRVAEVYPQWPLYDRQKQPHSQQETRYLEHAEANGLWGRWHPLDLAFCYPLLRAWDILRPILPPEEEAELEERLFVYQKDLLDRATGQTSRYTNLVGYHLSALTRVGLVLQRPEYIHQVVRYWRKIFSYSFAPDGFFREVSAGYHNQIVHRIEHHVPPMLKGYGDPPGYRDAISGERFDELDLAAEQALVFQQIRDGFNVLALPDGTLANFNDAWPRRLSTTEGLDRPGLLGISGIAKLHAGGMSALMKFGGIRGHDHRDALGLVWYAAGKEVFSDTSYHALRKGSPKFDRAWSTSTASHFTAAMDGERHFEDRTGLLVPDPFPSSAFVSRPPAQPGEHPVEATLPVAARFLNQGKLLLWDARDLEAQAMEAEQPAAYPGKATLFRRTLVMVPLEGEGGYLVEIFRMRGGGMHDYFLRGGLDEPYELTFNQRLSPASETLYDYIRLREAGPVRLPVEAVAAYGDGVRVVSRLAGAVGPQPARLQLLVGEAAAIRREGEATYSVVRRTAEGAGPLETCWVWVHEAAKGTPRIRNVALACSDGNALVTVTLPDRVDRVFSAGEAGRARFERDGWTFEGRLAYGSQSAQGAATGRVFRGGLLSAGSRVVAEGTKELSGSVVSTTSRTGGDDEDALLVRPDQTIEGGAFHLAQVDFGHGIRFSIPVEKVEPSGDGILRVRLSHSPGFVREEGAARMTQYPGWRVKGETRVRLE